MCVDGGEELESRATSEAVDLGRPSRLRPSDKLQGARHTPRSRSAAENATMQPTTESSDCTSKSFSKKQEQNGRLEREPEEEKRLDFYHLHTAQ